MPVGITVFKREKKKMTEEDAKRIEMPFIMTTHVI